jgi:2-polyprenyl-3-methyl-5-hydroxy-6-metoxy-1,4-benzoquinol methylase
MAAIDQQQQTKIYFNLSSRGWQAKAKGSADRYNVIKARNAAVLDIIKRDGNVANFLDVGCATGQLAIDVANLGVRSRGVDFAPEMIRIARENNEHAKAAAEFECASFFDLKLVIGAYDVISAMGFIEYVSVEQLDLFLERCNKALRTGGALAIGSRNRLFNIFSLNDYTLMEIQLGTLGALVREAVTFRADTQRELFTRMAEHERIDPQPTSHPSTGISVDVRYQFSPADLIFRARRNGFEPGAIYPIHFHGLPPACKDAYPGIHAELAKTVEAQTLRDHRLVPYCSSFVLELRKSRHVIS